MPHNIEQVVADIEDFKDDLQRNLKRAIAKAMRALMETAISHVKSDADWKGNLAASLRSHGVQIDRTGYGTFELSVGTDADIAPYAPFVELGTGKRSDVRGPTSVLTQPPHEYPAGYPYEAPSMTSGLVDEIIKWVKTKPVIPKNGDMTQRDLGFKIAATIVEEGTYAHPYLRPAWYKHRPYLELSIRSAVKRATR